MSRFSGPQGKGAMRRWREGKRDEAEARNAVANASIKMCGHVHGERLRCEQSIAPVVERLLAVTL